MVSLYYCQSELHNRESAHTHRDYLKFKITDVWYTCLLFEINIIV